MHEVSLGEYARLGSKERAARADNKPTRSHCISYSSSLCEGVGLPLRPRALATMLEPMQWMSKNIPIEWVNSQHVCLLSMAHRVVTKLWLPNVADWLNYATQHASCIIKVSTRMCNFGTLKHRVSFADSQGLFPHTTWSVLGVLAQTVIRRPLLCLCESAVAADMWAAAWDTRKRPKLQRLPWAEPPAPRHCLLFSPASGKSLTALK